MYIKQLATWNREIKYIYIEIRKESEQDWTYRVLYILYNNHQLEKRNLREKETNCRNRNSKRLWPVDGEWIKSNNWVHPW